MKILMTGVTGFIGWHVFQALRVRGHHIVACVRDPMRAQMWLKDAEIIRADFTHDCEVKDWLPRLRDIDVVINAVGIIQETPGQSFEVLHHRAPAALFQACIQASVKRVVQISALGADAEAETAYHLTKRVADEVLMDSNLSWYVLRPSIVYGPRAASFALFRALATLPIIPLPEGGHQLIQPIHIDDLSRAVVQCAEGKIAGKQLINAVGPTPLSLQAFLSQLRQGLSTGKLRVLPIPFLIASSLARINEVFDASPLTRDSLRMLQRGNHANVQPFIKAFGFTPKAVNETLSLPTQAELWQARLYFLRPLLRLSIAFTWLSAGLVSAFFYPAAQSYAMLQTLGASDWIAPLLLYSAAGLDCVLGLATLSTRWVRLAGMMQIAIMLLYTVIITMFLPEYWLHPFGPVVKNLPLLAATLIMLAMEKN